MRPRLGLVKGLPVVALLASALLSFVGCGEEETPPGEPADATAGAGGNAGTTAQIGGSGGASGAAAGMGGTAGSGSAVICPEAAPRPQATLDLVQQGNEASVRAFFPLVTVPEPGSECVHRTEDTCVVETCLRPLPAAPLACAEERITGENAGTITLTGGAGTRTLSFAPQAKPPGYPESKGAAIFTGGETVTLSALGGAVPGFQTALLAPIAIAFPTLSPNMVIARSQGLTFTWKDSGKASIELRFAKTETVTTPSASKETRVVCVFPGTALQGKVPATALTDLPLGPVDFTLTQLSSNVVTAGNWDVAVRVIGNQIAYGATLE